MKTNRIVLVGFFLLVQLIAGTVYACDDPPIAQINGTEFRPIAAFASAGMHFSSNSYDPDYGYGSCCDWGITGWSWGVDGASVSSSVSGDSMTILGASSPCSFDVTLTVTEADGSTSSEARFPAQIFQMHLYLGETTMCVGETKTLGLSYEPHDLYAGYMRLRAEGNSGTKIQVKQGSTVVIDGSDDREMWSLQQRYVTIEACSAGTVTLYLGYTPDQVSWPGGGYYNEASITITVEELVDIDVLTVQEHACVGLNVQFSAFTDPPGYEDVVQWSGGGTPATGTGATFTTWWDSGGTKTVTGTIGAISDSEQFAIGEVTNFTESFVEATNGVLEFEYTWQSSTGDYDDLYGCYILEILLYGDESNPYSYPDPWTNVIDPNPATVGGMATEAYGSITDYHVKGDISTPYTEAWFSVVQNWYVEDCEDTLYHKKGPNTITREIWYEGGVWKYKVSKLGHSAETVLP